MKIKIENDLFNIVKRLKQIDKDYYVLYDTNKNDFEIHNKNQFDSFCLTIPYDTLDSRAVDLVFVSMSRNIDKIMEEIDKNNSKIENSKRNERLDKADFMAREIYNFASNSSKDFVGGFETKWR